MNEFNDMITDELDFDGGEQSELEQEPERGEQLDLSEQELKLLATQIDSDYQNSIADHETRSNRNKIYYELWRSRIGGAGGTEGKSNFKVPLTKWQLLGKLAKEVDALLGDDMQVVAVPVGPTDQAQVEKVGLWQTWRVKNDMKITRPLIEFLFNKLCYGRAFAYLPYDIETYMQKGEPVVWREGPKFIPIETDDFIVPSERAKSLHDFSFVIRRYLTTPDELLEGEDSGMYFGITDNWQDIMRAAQDSDPAGDESQPVQDSKDILAGVNTTASQSMGEFLEVLEWYGNWRMLKSPGVDAQPDDFDNRDMRRTELVVRYLKNSNRIISVQRLEDLYPNMPKRRPFVESKLYECGEYWSPGIPEMLIDIEAELTVNNNLTTEAGEASVGPLIGVRPSAAQKLKQTHWEPRLILEVDDPERDIKMLQIGNVNMQYAVAQEQKLRSYAELVTGLPEQSLGRAPDRPNAPRTARGQILMDENANIRLGLDMLVVKEDFKEILQRIWMLDVEYAPESMFFRVTEQQAKGLFATEQDFAEMTAEERAGRYDFDIQFATSVYSREAKKETSMQLAQLTLGQQMVAMNPRAVWMVLDDLYKAFGRDNFASIVPKPPEQDLPVEAEEEWARALQGLDVHVHPLDQDVKHIEVHKAILEEQMAVSPKRRDQNAINKMIAHILEHEAQKAKKLQMAAQVAAQMAAMQAAGIDPAQMMQGQEPQMPGMPPQGGMPIQ
jgi:hypothetical protein